MNENEKMDYEIVSGTSSEVDSRVNAMLSAGWQIVSETDSRAVTRKFSGGKAVGGALLLGPVGLFAGGIGKDRRSGEIRVRLARPAHIGEEIRRQQAVEEEKRVEQARLNNEAKAKAKAEWKAKPVQERIDHKIRNNVLAKSPVSSMYWYKKFRDRKKGD